VGDATERQVKTTIYEGDTLGDQCGFPKDKGEMHQDSLQQKNHPMEQLEEVVEEIRKLMLELIEELVSRRKLGNRKPTQATGMMQE
jgi:hypothetical protein